MTSVLITKKKKEILHTHTHMHTRTHTHREGSEVEEWCGPKPRKASRHEKLEKTGSSFFPRVSGGSVALPTP